jgi:hypothetical protein
MILKNCIGIETRHGYRTFEFYEGKCGTSIKL